MLSGIITAIVTPFAGGKLDEESLINLVEFQIRSGVHGIVPCGTTGESPTLNIDEFKRVVQITVETVKNKVPVIAGAGANSTSKAIEYTRLAKSLRADATLQVAPYYNKPSQEGLFQHFKAIAAVGLPMVLYNIPGRSAVDILPETVARLAELPEIIAIKEASGSITRIAELNNICGDRLTILTGDDAQALPSMSLGAKGVISVLSNLLPKEMVELYGYWQERQLDTAIEYNNRIFPLMQAMFIEPNPVPVKTALTLKGIIKSAETRLPLSSMSENGKEQLTKKMQETGIF